MARNPKRLIESDPDWWPNPHQGYGREAGVACMVGSMIWYLTTGEYVTYRLLKPQKENKNGRYTPPKR